MVLLLDGKPLDRKILPWKALRQVKKKLREKENILKLKLTSNSIGTFQKTSKESK